MSTKRKSASPIELAKVAEHRRQERTVPVPEAAYRRIMAYEQQIAQLRQAQMQAAEMTAIGLGIDTDHMRVALSDDRKSFIVMGPEKPSNGVEHVDEPATT